MKRSLVIGIAAGALLFAAGTAAYLRTHSPAAASAVSKFYFMWTDSSIHPLVERSYHGSPYLTREFQRRLDRLGRTFGQTGDDPVVCAKAMPAGYDVSFAEGDGRRPVLAVTLTGRDGERVRALASVTKQDDGTWLIDDIACPPPPMDRKAAEAVIREQIGSLSSTKAVLGGTFSVTKIDWKNDASATVSYEDGHIALQAEAAVEMQGGRPVVTKFTESAL